MNLTRHQYRKSTDRSGFSLVEVILALAIFSMAIGGILGILASSARTAGNVLERTSAVSVLKYATSLVDQGIHTGEIYIDGLNTPIVVNDVDDIDSLFPMRFTSTGVLVRVGATTVDPDLEAVEKIPFFYLERVEAGNNTVVEDVLERVAIDIYWPWTKDTTPVAADKSKLSKFSLKHVVVLK